MKKIRDFIYREKGVLILTAIVFIMVIAFSVTVTMINDESESDTEVWLEVVIVGFLINFFCSLIIIAFFDDQTKKDNLAKKNYFLKKVATKITSISNVVINMHNKVLPDMLESAAEKRTYMMKTNIQEMIESFYTIDFSKKDAPYIMPAHGSLEHSANSNWLEYYIDTFSTSIKYINAFKELLVQYIGEDFFECFDALTDLEYLIRTLRYNDSKIINNDDYSKNLVENNHRLDSLKLLETIITYIRNINTFMIKETNKQIQIF